jgi:hypothetical protein
MAKATKIDTSASTLRAILKVLKEINGKIK